MGLKCKVEEIGHWVSSFRSRSPWRSRHQASRRAFLRPCVRGGPGEFNKRLRLAAADQKNVDATVQDRDGRDLSVQLKVAAYLFRLHAPSCEVQCDAHNGFFGAVGVFAGAGFLFRRRRSIAARLGSNQGGRLNISPDLPFGTSVAKPGPSVAMAKFTPHGPRK